MIDASVWIAPSIWKLVSDGIERSSAETNPTESDWRSPNGLPIAATCSPTSTSSMLPISTGWRSRPSGSTLISATSAKGSKPITSASTELRSGNWTKTSEAWLIGAVLADGQSLRVRDDVRVGDDLTLVGDHEARALARLGRVVGRELAALGLELFLEVVRPPPLSNTEITVTTPGAARS